MNETQLDRPLRAIERETLETLLSVDFPGVAELRAQIPLARLAAAETTGWEPSFNVTVPKAAPPSAFSGNLAPIEAYVYDANQEYTGEFLIWIAHGYLAGVEYAWITDEPPADLPDPSTIQVSVKN
jgi:hypothetical protein